MPDQHLFDRLRDLAEQAADQGFLTYTHFLSPAEQNEAGIWLKKNHVRHVFSGGFDGAERQVCFLLPDYLADSELAGTDVAEVITALRLQAPARSAPPGHRDYLGSLLGLGIRRDQLGDVLVQENTATVLVLTSLAAFIETSLERVGAATIRIEPVPLAEIAAVARTFTLLRVTVASLRLDKIAACGFGLSRSEMADEIRSGAVQVNWIEERRPDQEIAIGTVISLRGQGRIRLASEEGLSRKDRHILTIERY